MAKPDFIYTTYIETTPEKVWEAITNPEFSRQYWGMKNVSSDWKRGSEWKHVADDGRVKIIGNVVESNPPKKLVLSWAAPSKLDDESHVTFTLEQIENMTRLDVVHGGFNDDSTMHEGISKGWPRVLSGLKTYLESGKILNIWAQSTSCAA